MRKAASVQELLGATADSHLHEQHDATTTLTRHYQLITPLFGGGFDAGIPDHTKAISETTVRGHLRFWWRATRGADEHITTLLESIKGCDQGAKAETSLLHDLERDKEYQKLDDAKKRLKRLYTLEGWLFGCAAQDGELKRHPHKRLGPSRVGVRVLEIKANLDDQKKAFDAIVEKTEQDGKPLYLTKIKPNATVAPGYASFPLRPQDVKPSPTPPPPPEQKFVLPGVEFSVVIEVPKTLKLELEAALWAWSHFGGVGARTRRGFGALQDRDQPKTSIGELKKGIETHVQTGMTWAESVPHLPGQLGQVFPHGKNNPIRLCGPFPSLHSAWTEIIDQLRSFRQDQRIPRHLNHGRPGRTFWPEPDTIGEKFQGKRSTKHQHRTTFVSKFPRGQFGVPIGFELRDEPFKGQKFRTELTGKGDIQRLASRLILRPIQTDKGCFGLALILQAPLTPPGGLRIKLDDNQWFEAEIELDATADLRPLLNGKLTVLNGEADVLKAFLNQMR